MHHNTKLAFRSFRKGSEEEKLIQMKEFLKIISSKFTNMFLSFVDLVTKSLFSHLEV